MSKPRDSRYQTTKDLLINLQNLKEHLRFDASLRPSAQSAVSTKTASPVRTNIFRYKGQQVNAQAVANELNVEAVLTGRLTQHGDNLIISVELIDGTDNSQIWGTQYNRRLADLFTVPQELAKDILSKLRLKLSRTEQQQLEKSSTADLQAFQYYMQGRAYVHRNTREDWDYPAFRRSDLTRPLFIDCQ